MSNIDVRFNSSIFRKDHPIIIAANRHLASIKPVRMYYNASGYAAGTVVAKNTTGGYWVAYANGGSSGTGTAVCILFEDIDVSEFESATSTRLARGIFGGEVFADKCTLLDSTAKTSLGGRTISSATGTNIFKF